MKADAVLKMLNENKIEELKQKLIEEIGKEEHKGISSYKAIQKLAEKTSKDKLTKCRPILQGAYFLNGKTVICNGIYGLILNDEISGLKMVEEKGDYFDLEQAIPKDNLSKLDFNLNDIKNTIKLEKANGNKDTIKVELGNSIYDAKNVVAIAECLDNCEIYKQDDKLSILVLKGTNGTGIVCAMRY